MYDVAVMQALLLISISIMEKKRNEYWRLVVIMLGIEKRCAIWSKTIFSIEWNQSSITDLIVLYTNSAKGDLKLNLYNPICKIVILEVVTLDNRNIYIYIYRNKVKPLDIEYWFISHMNEVFSSLCRGKFLFWKYISCQLSPHCFGNLSFYGTLK